MFVDSSASYHPACLYPTRALSNYVVVSLEMGVFLTSKAVINGEFLCEYNEIYGRQRELTFMENQTNENVVQ